MSLDKALRNMDICLSMEAAYATSSKCEHKRVANIMAADSEHKHQQLNVMGDIIIEELTEDVYSPEYKMGVVAGVMTVLMAITECASLEEMAANFPNFSDRTSTEQS